MSFDIVTAVQAAGDLDKAGGVDFEDSFGIRMVTDLGRITGEGEDVMHAECRCSQELCLKADDISVAAGQMEDGLDLVLLLDDAGEGDRAHTHFCHGAVGDIDCVDVGSDFLRLLFRDG
ncbi:Uncharacterised protein [Bacteroides xylanisolvens]|nr:Uncharacterised protein [Bacteroides xylanisolvens]